MMDDISTANTEEGLLGSRHSSETISSANDGNLIQCCQPSSTKISWFKSPTFYIVLAVALFIWGVATVIWTPFQVLMDERIRMTPGLPPYEWWKNPPDKVLFRVYIFNVTNSEEFLNKTDTKLNFVELGPLVFMEKLTHTNVTFNENGTITYVATRRAIFLPDRNHLDLNSVITVPNWALLGIASYLSDQSFFVKFGFNLLTRTVKPEPFVKLTINDFLWNFTDPILDSAQKIAPFMVPIKNLGVLARIYTNFVNQVTVYTGTKFGHDKFFLIDKYDGLDSLPNYDDTCPDRVVNSTEGVTYPQFLTKNTTLKYWRNTLCKNAILDYSNELVTYGIKAYRYNLRNTTFNRTEPRKFDCYKSEPALPNGLSDISKCHFGFPLATSFPHFLHGDDVLNNYVTGLSPNQSKHESFVIVEPTTGVPIESRARSQCNLVVRKMTGFHEVLSHFDDTIIPMFWIEYNQVGLPWYIAALMYFQVNVLPILQIFFTCFLLVTSVMLLCCFIKARKRQKMLTRNKVLIFEQEVFIK